MALIEFDYTKEPTVSIVKQILTDAVKMKASDIHFTPTSKGLTIKFRIDGDLIEYTTSPDTVRKNILTRIKILSGMNITETTLPQTGSIVFEYHDENYNMRSSTLPVLNGERIVVHLSNYENVINNLENLNISHDNLQKIQNIINKDNGLILISGITSSGKTTTMYTLVKELDSQSKSIISIENPIKLKIEGISQVQVNEDKGLTSNKILQNVLMQDPNVIVLNEMNDDETIRNVLRATTTGKLVISTMYANNAFDTIYKLTNMEIEKYLLKSSLSGIISQRLVKKLCPHCKTTRKANDYEKNVIKSTLNIDIDDLPAPVGCPKCINGFLGRIPVTEVIEINEEIKAELSSKTNYDLLRKLIYQNNSSILEDGLNKTINNETTFEEIIKITDLKNDFGRNNEKIKEAILDNQQDVNYENEQTEISEVSITNINEEETTIEIKQDDIINNKDNESTIENEIETNTIKEEQPEEINERAITPEEEKETDEITEKIKKDLEIKTNIEENQVNNPKAIEKVKNYNDFSYDESYINNF